MTLGPGLHLRQQQKLVMTPALQQALKILQLNSLELSDLVQQEISENPLLEERSSDEAEAFGPEEAALIEATAVESADKPGPEAGSAVEPSEPPTSQAESAQHESAGEPGDRPGAEGPAGDAAPGPEPEGSDAPPAADTEREALIDEKGALPEDSWQDYFDDNGTDYGSGKEQGEEEREGFEAFYTRPPSLQEHLRGQMEAAGLGELERLAMEELIGSVDHRGYLTLSCNALAERAGLPVPAVFHAMTVLQGFEPIGVGARDLRECLLLQLEALNRKGSLAWKIVDCHLKDLERKRPEALAAELKISAAALEEARHEIAALEPNPGRPFGWEPNSSITIDVVIEKDDEGEYQVSVLDQNIPRLGINNYYKRMLKAAEGPEKDEAKAYLQQKYQSAVWLIKSIDQRRKTLVRVTEAIAQHQKAFLDLGPSHLKPLTLREVAGQTGLHESTISRVTTRKYAQTPRGIFELKAFFSGGLATDSGEDASALSVKEKLKALLDTEAPQSPHSDQRLAEILNQQGIHIARRTVAKYREELRVPSAHLRKKN